MSNEKELESHFKYNENMWRTWKTRGVNEDTDLKVIFNFYASKKKYMELLREELSQSNIPFKITPKRTFLILKGWEVTANVTKKWTLEELQGKTGYMYLLSKQTGVYYEGCGAFMPN
ncbi:hypothetical protein A8C32_17625 [Flavivirga aquatica]|uniref:Regulator of ribonuclease activity B domain-containing protein n=1 Tax=Flavivirga aquatica TaxID=1849968 RepID=A0A1E5T8E6_9FLAO|nr:ribonuclease E inhibitor RraB [Flavivirga aquatica]OEK07616.1 hypothetical protein A8C32_17625 [Flavivirga aquatica]